MTYSLGRMQPHVPEQGVPPTRLVRRKVCDEVVDYLMVELFNGRLRTGDRLNMAGIASSLGISHAPVREAVIVLERDGVLTTVYHRGVFVAPFTPESVLESFELYGALSGLAASHVARLQESETMATLDAIVREMRKSSGQETLVRLHREFRRVVHRSGASLRVRNLLRNFGGILPASVAVLSVPEALEESTAQVQKILRAIRAGDPHAAAEAAYRSSSRAGWRVIRALEQRDVFEPRSSSLTRMHKDGRDDQKLFMGLLIPEE